MFPVGINDPILARALRRFIRGDRWRCPNDRQLAMRATSQRGWSVRTGLETPTEFRERLDNMYAGIIYGESYEFNEDELQTIIQVIQRQEALEQSEQQRLQQLLQRLEALKTNIRRARKDDGRCGSRCTGKSGCVCSCAMCAVKFGMLFGPRANVCIKCNNNICLMCSIEIKNDEASSSSRSSLSILNLVQYLSVQKIIELFNGNVQKQFLCRLYIEKTEIWKKSNGWFFKSMPYNYRL
ncbi:rab effector Noc2-like isoform X2 [Linepithema humile]